MHEYEIRILHADRTTDAIIAASHFDDHAAIRAAKKLAEARPFEVWRDLNCIYGRAAPASPPKAPSPRSAA